MEHTYIEQIRKTFTQDESGEKVEGYLLYPSVTENTQNHVKICTPQDIEEFTLKLISKVRTETLMECRGLVKDEELLADDKWEGTDEQRKHDMIAIIKNNERESFLTAIDNLIKKETI